MNDLCDLIDDFLDDQMTDDEEANYRSHLEECRQCQSAVQSQTTMDGALRAFSEAIQVPNQPQAQAMVSTLPASFRWSTLIEVCVVAIVFCFVWLAMAKLGDQGPVGQVTDRVAASPQTPSESRVTEPVVQEQTTDTKTDQPSNFERAKSLDALRIEQRAKTILLSQIKTLAARAKDPQVALGAIKQLTNRSPSEAEIGRQLQPFLEYREAKVKLVGESSLIVKLFDKEISRLQEMLEQLLVHNDFNFDPKSLKSTSEWDKKSDQLNQVIIERETLVANFGEGHPAVKQVESKLHMLRIEFMRMVRKESDLLVESVKQAEMRAAERGKADPAKEIVAIVGQLESEITSLEAMIKVLSSKS